MRFLPALLIASALSASCEMPGAWAEERREVAAPVLIVRQPLPEVAAAGVPLLQQPAVPSDGSDARPFPTLGAALAAAPAGALLRIEEGTWAERLTIVRPVVLMGRGPERTRILPPAGADPAVLVRADHVQFYGLMVGGAPIGLQFEGGTGHRLENVELRGLGEAGLVGRGAGILIVSSAISGIGAKGRGIDLVGGSLEARKLVLREAGRRAMVLRGARGLLEDVDAIGSALSALQATDGADVRVVRGVYDRQGGAALYAGGARLSVEGAVIRHSEYAVIGNRGSDLSVLGGELTDYRVAGVAMVNSQGSVQQATIARGGTEAAISLTRSGRKVPVLLVENRIQDPGTMGVHVTESSVAARSNSITGARLDREKDMGDAFFAVDSELVIEGNVLRGNAGSGIAVTRSKVRLADNGFIENGRAGVLLLERSQGTASGNLFERNAKAGVEVGELSRVSLRKNRFGGNLVFDIDTGCGRGLGGTADMGAGNTFTAPLRRRPCP